MRTPCAPQRVTDSAFVTAEAVARAVSGLGIGPGEVALVHSSLKSLGPVEGGAEAVIRGFEAVLGREGTLAMPTLCQVDFPNSYRTWYRDKPSDVGYLTEFFRKQPYVYRSDQATHSVAARGRLGYELTFEHTARGPHVCPFGETAFADSSPWLKLCALNAHVVFLGVTMRYNTLKHPVEARLVEDLLSRVPEDGRRALTARLRTFDNFEAGGIWPFYDSLRMQGVLDAGGLVRRSACGAAELLCVRAGDASRAAYDALSADLAGWYADETLAWIRDCQKAARA